MRKGFGSIRGISDPPGRPNNCLVSRGDLLALWKKLDFYQEGSYNKRRGSVFVKYKTGKVNRW